MTKKKLEFKKFEIPQSFFDTLYELSGGLDKNKGYFVFYIDEEGVLQVRHRCDLQATEFALTKLIEVFIRDNDEMREIHHYEDPYTDEDEDDDDDED